MKITDLVRRSGMILSSPAEDADGEVSRVYAADTISDLIAHASAGTLLVTHLDNPQLARVADLMDAPAICLVDGARPGAELREAAHRAGAAVVVSALGLAATVGVLEELLRP